MPGSGSSPGWFSKIQCHLIVSASWLQNGCHCFRPYFLTGKHPKIGRRGQGRKALLVSLSLYWGKNPFLGPCQQKSKEWVRRYPLLGGSVGKWMSVIEMTCYVLTAWTRWGEGLLDGQQLGYPATTVEQSLDLESHGAAGRCPRIHIV